MTEVIRKHYLSSYYIMTILLSGLLLLLHFIFKEAGNYSVTFPQLAPTLTLILIATILKDNTELYRIKRQLIFRKTDIKWALVFLLFSFVFIVPSSLLVTALGLKPASWSGNLTFFVLSILAVTIGCITEEIGWRGFLLPKLQQKYSPLVSSIILGSLWGIWHFNFTGGIWGYLLFVVTCVEMSFVMTWVYNRTNGNLILMILWHFFINILSRIFLWDRFGLLLYIVEALVFGVISSAIIIANRKLFTNKPVLRTAA